MMKANPPDTYGDLRVSSLKLENFRNYDAFDLEGIGPLTIFVGRNAVGKTNVLEALHLLTSASSFRHSQLNQLVKEGTSFARIEMTAENDYRRVTTALAVEPGKKRFTVNGKSKTAADVRGKLPSVAFTPDDMELAKKGASVKRDALDALGSQLSRNYYIVMKDYEKALRYKNRLLKEEASPLLVESINETLLTCASQLVCYRTELYRRIIPLVAAHYRAISESYEEFSASYASSWERLDAEDGQGAEKGEDTIGQRPFTRDEVRELLACSLDRQGEQERARKRSLVGPHADSISFSLDGKDAALFASQGQQRCIVLAWKLAEVDVIRSSLGISPVLLLDDVMSELDEQRRRMLVGTVTRDVQTFITATDLSFFSAPLLDRAHVLKLPLEGEARRG